MVEISRGGGGGERDRFLRRTFWFLNSLFIRSSASFEEE